MLNPSIICVASRFSASYRSLDMRLNSNEWIAYLSAEDSRACSNIDRGMSFFWRCRNPLSVRN